MAKTTLIVLYGGRSAEREVSVLSAESVIRAIDYDRFFVKTYFITQAGEFVKTQEFSAPPADGERLMTNATIVERQIVKPSAIYEEEAVVFPVLHGPMGEDGTIQGFLEVLGLAYVGSGVLASSVAMDKITTKRVLESVGIPQVPYLAILEGEDLDEKIASITSRFSYPVFVKPSNMGSSVGISKVEAPSDLRAAIQLAFQYDDRILVEQGVVARELEVGVIGGESIQTTCPGEVLKTVDFYDYQSKYVDHDIQMAIPANVPDPLAETMREYAALAFRSIGGGTGLARCDFFYTEDGHLFLNELNTMPGFTQWSMFALLWQAQGLSYSDLIGSLVQLAKEAFQKREQHFSK